MKKIILLIAACFLTACEQKHSDAEYWTYGFTSPVLYQMIIERVQVIMPDKKEYQFAMTGGTISGLHNAAEDKFNFNLIPGELPQSRFTTPPQSFVVGWFSVAENQFYAVYIPISDIARKEMQKPYKADCASGDTTYMNWIVIGVAPGGYVRAWLRGLCREPFDIGHFKGWKMVESMQPGNTYEVYKDRVTNYKKEFAKELAQPIPYDKWK